MISSSPESPLERLCIMARTRELVQPRQLVVDFLVDEIRIALTPSPIAPYACKDINRSLRTDSRRSSTVRLVDISAFCAAYEYSMRLSREVHSCKITEGVIETLRREVTSSGAEFHDQWENAPIGIVGLFSWSTQYECGESYGARLR